MGDNQRTARLICLARALFLPLTLLLMCLPPVDPVWAQQPVELLYAADFDDETAPGWSLDASNEGRWVAQVGDLIGKGRAWAVYREGYHWGGAGSYWYRFQLRYLEGTLHASIRTSEGRRYAIGLRNTDGLLNVELFKESPAGAFVELEPPQVLDFELPNEPPGFWIEIRAEEGRIELYVRDYTQEPVLVGEDDDPLPPGTLAFETLDDGVARINAVEVWGPPGQEGLPDLAILDAVWRLEEDLLVLRARVENQGPVESGPSEVYVELRPPQLGTTEPLPPLAPGQSEDVFLYLEFPQELRGETIGLVFNVDPDQRVEEADEGNNTVRLRGTTDPLEPPEREGLPDLTIADAGWHLIEDHDLLELRVLVENQGEAESGDSDVYAELPPPGRGTTEPLPPLAPGQSRNVSLNLEFPRELRGETIGLFINVDPGQRIEESNENNNADELKVTTDRPEPPGVPLAPIVAGVAALALGGLIYGLARALRGKPGTEPEGKPEERRPPMIPLPPVRLLRIWLSEGPTGDGSVLRDGHPLQAGSTYTLHLQIQPRGSQSEGASDSPGAGEAQRLRVVLFSPENDFGFAPETAVMSLPDQGASSEVRYPITAQRAGHRKFRAGIYYGNVLLQSALLEADILEEGERPQGGPAVSRVTDYVASLDLRALDSLPQPLVSLFTNRASDGSHWIGLFAQGRSAPESFRSGMLHTFGPQELASAAGELRTLLTDIQGRARYQFAESPSADPQHRVDRLERDLLRLATRGRGLYNALFFSRLGAAERADALLQFQELLQEPGIISVARCRSDVTSIPWAALYDLYLDVNAPLELCGVFKQQLLEGQDLLDHPANCRAQAGCPLRYDDGRTVCPFGFWGFLHQVEQPLQQVSPTTVDEVPPELASDAYEQSSLIERSSGAEVELAVAYYPRLPQVGQHLNELQALARSGRVQVRTEDERDKILKDMLRPGGSHLYYFYCHGEIEGNLMRLKLGPADQPGYLAAADLDPRWRRNWQGKPRPLVILNACETVAIVPERVGELMLQLRFLGSGGVVGTEIKVRTELASEVGTRLVQGILDGRSVGEAFLDIRRQLLRQYNPLGLAYTYHAPATLHLHTPDDCAWCRSHLRGRTAR